MDNKNNLAKIRESRRLRQPQVAEAIGISVAQLSRLENGTRPLHVKRLREFASYYGVSESEILGQSQHVYTGFGEAPAAFAHKQPDNFEKAWIAANTYAIMTGVIDKVSGADMTRFVYLLEREISEHGDIPAKEKLVALAKQAGCV